MNKLLPILFVVFISADAYSEWPPENQKVMMTICMEQEIGKFSYKVTSNYCNCFVSEISSSTDYDGFMKNTPGIQTLIKKIKSYCYGEHTRE